MANLTKHHKALITGGSRGLGAAMSSLLEDQGVEVIAPNRDVLDLSHMESIAAYVASEQGAGFDIIINNAGINLLNELTHVQDEDWQIMLQVNLTAPMALIRGFSPYMKAQKWGRIVNISSIFSLVTRENRSAYSATKAGLNGLTRTAAVELAPHGILVNAVCPGYVETELTFVNNSPEQLAAITATIPLQRLAQPHEIAKLVSFLCSEENTYLTGQTLVIDGGFTCK
ncbi:MAG: SDR family oxidoreductase [Microcystis sp. M038S2]|jgi:3-oxoacyl-[acyl-carrier protein] reductase|uniref:SDR family oxidoreductase n=2 Tax=Microcystis TaxID=1125 RepID=A0A552F880_MICAE|nr:MULTISPECIES: SDR family oxidoreductase [unclassified Microcystis]NCQ97451.1 SDR family oxidoreductase [Microcystis aeruginosa W11-03]NCR39971.1 SDR family oxidoreductase [Microcystis aeruginosa W13-11]NCR72721.1 SDR family oxidoreductase [Microcystis aeruginosa LG13-12]NCR89569.1 SDR family oxidoreductase [Microcystis aeruginosa G13-10]NCR95944.1 SDR family oxidoreductase [Microcystis aeruginosa W11-06]NCS33822.1 SDR family oxidoreductase [Microcystis aeruginosa G11-01]TRU42940.1 MAG: SD